MVEALSKLQSSCTGQKFFNVYRKVFIAVSWQTLLPFRVKSTIESICLICRRISQMRFKLAFEMCLPELNWGQPTLLEEPGKYVKRIFDIFVGTFGCFSYDDASPWSDCQTFQTQVSSYLILGFSTLSDLSWFSGMHWYLQVGLKALNEIRVDHFRVFLAFEIRIDNIVQIFYEISW